MKMNSLKIDRKILGSERSLGDVPHVLLFSLIFRTSTDQLELFSFIYCWTWIDFLFLCYELKYVICLIANANLEVSRISIVLKGFSAYMCVKLKNCFQGICSFFFKCHIDCVVCVRHPSL